MILQTITCSVQIFILDLGSNMLDLTPHVLTSESCTTKDLEKVHEIRPIRSIASFDIFI
jgi:hypothetical protein